MESVMENQITEFCKTPRTLKDVCMSYGLTPGTGYDTLKWMVYRGLLQEVMYEGCVLFRKSQSDIGM